MNFKHRQMTQLTHQVALDWKAGRYKYSYTNYYPKSRKGLMAVSGRYAYLIDFKGRPERISYNKVPKGYRNSIRKDLLIFRIPSKLVKIIKREGMK